VGEWGLTVVLQVVEEPVVGVLIAHPAVEELVAGLLTAHLAVEEMAQVLPVVHLAEMEERAAVLHRIPARLGIIHHRLPVRVVVILREIALHTLALMKLRMMHTEQARGILLITMRVMLPTIKSAEGHLRRLRHHLHLQATKMIELCVCKTV